MSSKSKGAIIPRGLFLLGLNNNEERVLACLIQLQNYFSSEPEKGFFIYQARIAKILGTDRRTIRRAVRVLREKGFINMVDDKKSAPTYWLNWNKINSADDAFKELIASGSEEEEVALPEPQPEIKEEPIEERALRVEDTETKPDTEPKEEEPQIIEKDWYRMNARLDGAERMSQDLNAFLVSNQSDLEESGFNVDEIVEEYNKRFDIAV